MTLRPKSLLMVAMLEECRAVRNGEYYAKRGVIDWSSWNWQTYPWAISIQMDNASFMRNDGDDGIIVLEMATSIPDTVQEPEIDDDVLTRLEDDAEAVLRNVHRRRDVRNNSLALAFFFQQSNVAEFHDVGRRVQGIVVSVPVKY